MQQKAEMEFSTQQERERYIALQSMQETNENNYKRQLYDMDQIIRHKENQLQYAKVIKEM